MLYFESHGSCVLGRVRGLLATPAHHNLYFKLSRFSVADEVNNRKECFRSALKIIPIHFCLYTLETCNSVTDL